MKRFLLAFPLILVTAVLVACATTGGQPLTPAQVAAALCTPVETAVSTITLTVQQNPNDARMVAVAAALTKAQPIITAACTAASTVTSDTVQALITQGLPAIGAILGTLPLPAAQLANIQTDFILAEAAVNIVDVVVQNIKAAQTATTIATAPTPLPAPPLPVSLKGCKK
jgi:hypothetical protein